MIKKIIKSEFYTIVVDKDNDTYVWGIYDNNRVSYPKIIDYEFSNIIKGTGNCIYTNDNNGSYCHELRDKHPCSKLQFIIKKIVSGGNHTFIISTAGMVYAKGSNAYGQLGITEMISYSNGFVAIGTKYKKIVCGGYHTFAFAENMDDIYAFGCGFEGRLGNGKEEIFNYPQKLKYKFKKISAGEWNR